MKETSRIDELPVDEDMFGSPLDSPSQFTSFISRIEPVSFEPGTEFEKTTSSLGPSLLVRDSSYADDIAAKREINNVSVSFDPSLKEPYDFSSPKKLNQPPDKIVHTPSSFVFSPPLTRSAAKR